MNISPSNCVEKLEELKKWQEKQQKILLSEQEAQRLLLTKKFTLTDENPVVENDTIIKPKPFLKRGQGLQKRFTVHPDTFRLNNLPKYKFAPKTISTKKTLQIDHRQQKQAEQPNRPISNQMKLKPLPVIESSSSRVNEQPFLDESSVTWSRMLEPTTSSRLEETRGEDEDLTDHNDTELFELLENKVDNSSFCSNISGIMRLINENVKKRPEIDRTERPKENESEFEIEDDETVEDVDEGQEENESVSSLSSSSSLLEDKSTNFRVRFSDRVTVNELHVSDSEESMLDLKPISDSIQIMENSDDDNITALIKRLLDAKQKETEENNELLKEKLKELDNEINIFQKQSFSLTKMKQEHELYKIELENEYRMKKKKLDEERVKNETILAEERTKFHDERTKFEKQQKNPTKKEREEIVKLKDHISELQQELKMNSTKNSTSQSRLRVKIRNLEKQIKENETEMDALRKENKKLDSENLRLRRQNNNKMLMEINRNISKLVPGTSPISDTNPISISSKSPKSNKKTLISDKRPLLTSSKRRSPSSSSLSSSEEEEEEDEDEVEDVEKRKTLQHQDEIIDPDETPHDDPQNTFKREIINSDGSRDIWYPNGNIKKISADGLIMKMLYFNKDIKETNISEGTIKYYYAETNTWQTTYLDGLEILEFPNGQTEHRYKNGKIEVHFSNGPIRITNTDDPQLEEEWHYPDGTIVKIDKNSDKLILMPNGLREIHTKENKRREYPDGTIKLVYPDGRQETKYSNGRIRLKDKDGNLLMDTDCQ